MTEPSNKVQKNINEHEDTAAAVRSRSILPPFFLCCIKAPYIWLSKDIVCYEAILSLRTNFLTDVKFHCELLAQVN